jgi:hypothetical protein
MSRPRLAAVDVFATAAALSCPVTLFVVAGPAGAVAGGVAVLAWLVAPVYGFALGQFGLAAAVPDPALSPRLGAAQAALFALLVLGHLRERRSAGGLVALGVVAAVLAGGVAAGMDAGVETRVLAAVLAGVVAVAAYGVHRYERVVLGLASDEVDA